ncbi:MAG: hypothetical protein ACXWWU_00450 [Candidatus Limnocylindria bacterium]
MRSVFAIGSAAWFLAAAAWMGDGRVGTVGDPTGQEAFGDPTVMAIHLAARLLFVGLALLALERVEWRGVVEGLGFGSGGR